MQAVCRGWQEVGRPLANVAIKLYFSHRLDLAVAITCQALVPAPAGLGLALSRGVRLLAAARVARGAEQAPEEAQAAEQQPGCGVNGAQERAAKRKGAAPPSRKCRPLPKGLGALPPLPLPRMPPGSLASCSVQSIGLPMMLVGQSAARAPMYAIKGGRLVRGLAGLAATFLLCRAVRTPFTGRVALLPTRALEFLFHTVVGPLAAASYLTTSSAEQSAGTADRMLCEEYKPVLQKLYMQLRQAGEQEAQQNGRAVIFASKGPSVEAIGRNDINACCLPGGIVFVHSALIEVVQGREDSLAFVLGHEVGHAIGRHSLEKAASTYAGFFCIDALVGLAERFIQSAAPSMDKNVLAGRLRTLDGMLQGVLYLLQLGQSRRQEYEADELAMQLGASAGMNRCSLFSGAQDVLHKFMRLESGHGLGSGGFAQQTDGLLSTHPAAVNRLRRLLTSYKDGAA